MPPPSAADEYDDSADPVFVEWIVQLKSYHDALRDGDYTAAVEQAPGLLERSKQAIPSPIEGGGDDTADTAAQPARLTGTIVESYAKALLLAPSSDNGRDDDKQHYESVLRVLAEHVSCMSSSPSLQGIYLYALYRLERYDAVQQRLDKSQQQPQPDDDGPSPLLHRHLRAQVSYNVGNTGAAYETLANELQERRGDSLTGDERVDLWTNLVASLVATNGGGGAGTAVAPYCCRSTPASSSILRDVQAHLRGAASRQDNNEEYPYDLAYNYGTLEILTSSSAPTPGAPAGGGAGTAGEQLLRAAVAKGRRALLQEGAAPEEIAKELAPILTNIEWCRNFTSDKYNFVQQRDAAGTGTTSVGTAKTKTKGDSTAHVPRTVQIVRDINYALSRAIMSHPQEALQNYTKAITDTEGTKKWTPLQHRIALYNKAVLLYRCHKYDACDSTCQTLLSSLGLVGGGSGSSSSSKKKKGKGKQQPVPATEPSSSGSNKAGGGGKSDGPAPPSSIEEKLWWESRVVVLQAYVSKSKAMSTGRSRSGDEEDAEEDEPALVEEETETDDPVLKSLKTQLEEMQASPIRDHALAYVQIHSYELSSKKNKSKSKAHPSSVLELLQSLPASIQSKPAVIVTIATLMYENQGQTAQAEKLLRDKLLRSGGKGGSNDSTVLADFHMSLGNYEKAAEMYETIAAKTKSNDPVVQAKYVQALSYADPTKSLELWKRLKDQGIVDVDVALSNADDEEEEVNGAELEQRELPRLKSHAHRKTSVLQSAQQDASGITSDMVPSTTKKKRSYEDVLRQRAKKREAYLAELEKKGLYRKDHPSKPDPERWLPKYERSNARRRRNRYAGGGAQHKGAQGGVSERDAAKLDVAARQAARAAGEADPGASSGPSTAHKKAVSSGGGRRR